MVYEKGDVKLDHRDNEMTVRVKEKDSPATMISHSTSSSTPFGKNKLTSPIILYDLISLAEGVVSLDEELSSVPGRASRIKVSSTRDE
jgi:hypothetical protein